MSFLEVDFLSLVEDFRCCAVSERFLLHLNVATMKFSYNILGLRFELVLELFSTLGFRTQNGFQNYSLLQSVATSCIQKIHKIGCQKVVQSCSFCILFSV